MTAIATETLTLQSATGDLVYPVEEVLCEIPNYNPFDLSEGYFFNPDLAQRALNFFPQMLCHVKAVRGNPPFFLEKWQAAIVANLYGWVNHLGHRRYRQAFIYVPRKNGKTNLTAGLTILSLLCDDEPGAEIYSAGSTRDQASLCFNIAAGMVEKNPALRRHLKIKPSYKSMRVGSSMSVYRAISSDAPGAHGYNTHCAIIDELHAHRNGDLVEAIETSTGSRDNPMLIYITTADYNRESVCNHKYNYACKVRDGLDDPRFLPVIYEATVDDDWTDEAIWEKANPNLDISLHRDWLREKCKQAQEEPSFLNSFLRLHLNVRTDADEAWLDLNVWDENSRDLPENLADLPCYGGLDLSTTTDISAFVLVFPEQVDDGDEYKSIYHLLCRFWVPKNAAIKRERDNRAIYQTWSDQGFITLTDGDVIDYGFIRKEINDLREKYDIQEIGFDPWNAKALVNDLIEQDGFDMVEHRQGYLSMSDPSKSLERKIMNRELNHCGNPVLRWMASNVSVEKDPTDNIKPSKKKSSEKIDGIIATVIAVARADLVQEDAYSDRGIVFI